MNRLGPRVIPRQGSTFAEGTRRRPQKDASTVPTKGQAYEAQNMPPSPTTESEEDGVYDDEDVDSTAGTVGIDWATVHADIPRRYTPMGEADRQIRLTGDFDLVAYSPIRCENKACLLSKHKIEAPN